MKRRATLSAILARPAGPWLRCFLGAAFFSIWFSMQMCRVVYGQIAVESPIRVSHVDGFVVNSSGDPVANAEITLVRDDKVMLRTQTDQSGAFALDGGSGNYWFHVSRTNAAPAGRQIVVSDEIVTALRHNKIYVVLGPGACMDECSSVSTNKRDFDRAVRKRSKH
jgi:hypothetical protein